MGISVKKVCSFSWVDANLFRLCICYLLFVSELGKKSLMVLNV